MGFCRRCGDIVAGTRCRCGGTAVAPAVSFNREGNSSGSHDRWSKTYVAPQRSPSPVRVPQQVMNSVPDATTQVPTNTLRSPSTKRFPRPKSTTFAPSFSLKSGVSDHITLATSPSPRPPSPLKYSATVADAAADIIPSFSRHEPMLSKVYGSILQPADTLPLHSCAICASVFPPDATIYPNLSDSPSGAKTFLCKSCFTTNGGTKGVCPSCSRPVLALKAEGGFIQTGGKYWHKRCFSCTGCFKNIGDAPMVDLLGRPTCVECFDNCLKREPTTPKKGATSNNNSPSISNPGGLNASYGPGGKKSRESSPAIEELEQRLGIVKSREGSPAINMDRATSSRNSMIISPLKSTSGNESPLYDGSPKPRRFHSPNASSTRPRLSRSMSGLSLGGDSPSRNPLFSTPPKPPQSVVSPTSSPSSSHSERNTSLEDTHDVVSRRLANTTPTAAKSPKTTVQQVPAPAVTSSPVTVSASSTCGRCSKPILNPRQGGQFVTIPGADENTVPQLYHSDCFKCSVCDKGFNDAKKGQVSFVQGPNGPCHPQCTPTERFVVRMPPQVKSLPMSPPPSESLEPRPLSTIRSNAPMPPPSSRFERPLAPPHSPTKPSHLRFGGQATCPGCQKPVSPMERGVVPGPQGSRWHSSCLVCGGRKEVTTVMLLGRPREERKKGEPGCGKKLDSAAKSDGEGGVWCRECLLLLGVGGSRQGSPARSPLVPSFTGSSNKLASQVTGTTTLARQFTGVRGGEAILRQLTGGGLSPTRSISPTKQLGMMGSGGTRSRPKSVIGLRSAKSIDEGRGMFLVRQMTGSSSGGL
ncbi:unnamed protein product [Cyclocybe aegerita]|uniref:LIM zinc-binding domain-containing protein n=1 Tax=Cyclocybe aegerita TaxID=1973307 RepID=A0A8S0XVQ8_CYCAE|nr:unnamed protein product [Cyclocybe aegerita]